LAGNYHGDDLAMTCPHLQNGRCALAELLARKALGAELACEVTEDHCCKCLASGVATEEKPTLQVTAAVTRVRPESQKREWSLFVSRLHHGKPEPRPELPVAPAKRQPIEINGQRRPPQAPGPGTALAHILKDEYNAKEEADCPCTSRLAMMNANGVEWCEANIETIVDWLLEEVERRKLPQRLLPDRVKRWGLRRIIRRAIQTSKDWTPTAADS
jgi:hypothetical protein